MCAGGRIVNYLKGLIENERTDVLFIGYQAAGTPGRVIQQYGSRKGAYVELDGKRYAIHAGIHTISGYSAHADQKDLLNFVRRMRHKPKQIRIVHGDDAAKKGLRKKFKECVPQTFLKGTLPFNFTLLWSALRFVFKRSIHLLFQFFKKGITSAGQALFDITSNNGYFLRLIIFC